MQETSNKILVALDGSQRGFKTIQYLCSFKPFLKKELVLHNIITRVPECYYDFEKDPESPKANFLLQTWEQRYRVEMELFMEKSKTMLIAAGFKPEAISIIIAWRNKGIARDIMDEARKGYDALLIRRRGGAEMLLPLAMGSVSTKLVEKTICIPVMLAGIQTVNHSLLIAVDGSPGSRRAVEFAAKMIENSHCRVVLCSVLRDFDLYNGKMMERKSIDCITTAFEKIETAVQDSGQILENAGIQRKNIVNKIIQGAKSRAWEIVEAARQENCDTLIFGRKGNSDNNSFDVGRVPWKVIQGAKEMTVWIIP